MKTQINQRIHEVGLVFLPSTYINEVLFKINFDITTEVWFQRQLLITTTTATATTTTITTTSSITTSATTTTASAVAITTIVAVSTTTHYYYYYFEIHKTYKSNMQKRGEDAHQPAYPCSLISLHHGLIL